MSSVSHVFEALSPAQRVVRRLAGPRPRLLVAFAALVVLILAACVYVVLDSQAKTRREAEKRFSAEATISAELTASIFTASAGAAQQSAAKTFGGRTVDEHALTSAAVRSRQVYALIVGGDGKVIAASSRTPAAARERARAGPDHIREALDGRPWLSDVLPAVAGSGGVIEWALPFETPFGRRVEVSALSSQLIFRFLGGYLARTRSNESDQGYVLDSKSRIVGTSGGTAAAGDRPAAPELLAALASQGRGTYSDGGVERYYASAPVAGSSWQVVLSEPTAGLYPAQAGSRGWLLWAVLVAFGLAGAVSLLFLRRALVNGAQVANANRELTAVNSTLEERVAERTAAAEERARELARSNAELEEFASVASHDLQEPLRKIRMFGDRLREGLGDDLQEEPAADLERMRNAAHRMQQLITDLLAFSRVTSRGGGFGTVDLAEVTSEVLDDLEARVVELDAQVDVGDLPTIEADRTQMRQLIQNLVSNALKFHRPDEPPLIRIRSGVLAGRRPRLAGEATFGDQCVITVEDNGIGFEEKYADRIFTAFQRLHRRSAYEGTGIGLSIARKIVWRHGGDITAQSAPGKGSTFTVTLPLTHGNGESGPADGGAQ